MVEGTTSPKRKASAEFSPASKRMNVSIRDLRLKSDSACVLSVVSPLQLESPVTETGSQSFVHPYVDEDGEGFVTHFEDIEVGGIKDISTSSHGGGHHPHIQQWTPTVAIRSFPGSYKGKAVAEIDRTHQKRVSRTKVASSNYGDKAVKTTELDVQEYGYVLSSKMYVAVKLTFTTIQGHQWAKFIKVSCTYNGVEVAGASGHLIDRELIREDFYDSVLLLGRPTSDRISELLDHHGYFRFSIKEHYLCQNSTSWDNELDTGSILQIDQVNVKNEWRQEALGDLAVKSLIDKAKKWDASVKFAFAVPTGGCFWNLEEMGIVIYAGNAVGAEKATECFFLDIGFTRVAKLGWFVLDITLVGETSDASGSEVD